MQFVDLSFGKYHVQPTVPCEVSSFHRSAFFFYLNDILFKQTLNRYLKTEQKKEMIASRESRRAEKKCQKEQIACRRRSVQMYCCASGIQSV